jgi:catechol-2,3-dioxygenase
MSALEIGHFGLRTKDIDRAIEWYSKAFEADVRFRNEFAAFMSFDDEHHRFVIWDDGETEDRSPAASGVDHIGFMCRDPAELAENYKRLKQMGIIPSMSVNHHFTSSLYYRDPDGNEVEISCDNLPTKEETTSFMKSEAMAEAMKPPFFGAEFDPEELLRLYRAKAPLKQLARIGL